MLQALADHVAASATPPPAPAAHPAAPRFASRGSGGSSGAAGARTDVGVAAVVVMQRLAGIVAEVLGAAVDPDQPLMEVIVETLNPESPTAPRQEWLKHPRGRMPRLMTQSRHKILIQLRIVP